MDKVISRRDFIVWGWSIWCEHGSGRPRGMRSFNAGLPSTDTDASGTSTHKAQIALFLRGLSKWMKGMWPARRSAMS